MRIGTRGDQRGQGGADIIRAVGACGEVVKRRIVEARHPGGTDQAAEEMRLDRADGDVFTVGGREDTIGGAAQDIGLCDLAPGLASGVPHTVARGDPAGQRVGDRHVQILASPRGVASAQRSKNGDDGIHGCREIPDRHASRVFRRSVGRARDRHRARHRRVVQIMPRPVVRRPGLTIAADRTVDKAGIERRKRLIVDAQPRGHARAITLDHDVRPFGQPQESRAVCVVLEVQGDALLAAVHGGKEAGEHGARGVARGTFDLDDLGPHLGQLLRGIGSGQKLGQIEDAKPRKRCSAGHFCAPMLSVQSGSTIPAHSAESSCSRIMSQIF